MTDHHYRGYPDRRVVVIKGGEMKSLPVRLDLRNHSPDGFNWGYHGSGPAQLALALLADALGDDLRAEFLYQQFKAETVATWPMGKSWEIDAMEVRCIAEEIEKRGGEELKERIESEREYRRAMEELRGQDDE